MATNTAVTSNNLNGKTLSALIDFDFIVNSELGLIRFIKIKFRDPRAFKIDILNKSDREILSLLYSRENINPLSIISTEENMKDIDGLYNSFFDTYKREIIDLSVVEKSIFNFVNMVISSRANYGINLTISVRDDIEKNEIKSHFNGFNQFIDRSDIASIRNRNPYYVKDYSIFTDNGLIDLSDKKIYTSPRKYNMNYFINTDIMLTRNNSFMLMGKDYSKENIKHE